MPAGLSWGQYLRVSSVCLLSLLAGAQSVHYIYRPLDDFYENVQKRKQEIRAERAKSTEEKKTLL